MAEENRLAALIISDSIDQPALIKKSSSQAQS